MISRMRIAQKAEGSYPLAPVPVIDTKHQRAALIIILLAIGIVIAMSPYATGLLGIPVLYVVFAPLYNWLKARMKPGIAAGICVAVGVIIILVPGASLTGLIVGEAQGMAEGVAQSPVLERLQGLRIGRYEVGPQLATVGQRAVTFIGASLFALLGTATRLILNLAIAFFGLYYLLTASGSTWKKLRPYIPFSSANAEKLAKRFRDVTVSTLIGTGVTAAIQGILVG